MKIRSLAYFLRSGAAPPSIPKARRDCRNALGCAVPEMSPAIANGAIQGRHVELPFDQIVHRARFHGFDIHVVVPATGQ